MPATFTDPRQEVLRALRDIPMAEWNKPAHAKVLSGYLRAVINVCRALEANAQPGELWQGGKLPADLTAADNLGEHLAATRRQFGLLA